MKINIDDLQKRQMLIVKILEKCKNKVPKEVVELWKEYGFGTFIDGYLKVV
ncbi:GAD-like domain-containing protein [Enterococcus sp. AZ101]|uniref:GAD-like domain-containing protein n=1 Tax=Enterococcus sp. AZ101 TaxID=2774742 RepID=UPI003D28A45D